MFDCGRISKVAATGFAYSHQYELSVSFLSLMKGSPHADEKRHSLEPAESVCGSRVSLETIPQPPSATLPPGQHHNN